jgi:hypothetical protein
MRPISDVTHQKLTWTRPSARKRAYELRAGAEVVATLCWEHAWGSRAVAEAGNSRWTFRRVGFRHPRVTVRAVGSETDLATYSGGGMGRGTLDLSPTRRFQWGPTRFWHRTWAWRQTDGTPLVHFKIYGLIKIEGTVEVGPAAALPELDLLVPLGWYLLPFGWYRLAMLVWMVIEAWSWQP